MNEPKFHVGDVVRIREDSYAGCPFGWNQKMSDFCGKEATITRYRRFAAQGKYGYYIDIDMGSYTWCENCFEAQSAPDIDESDEDISVLFS